MFSMVHPLYMVFGTLEWGLGSPIHNLRYLRGTWGLLHLSSDPQGRTLVSIGDTPKVDKEFVVGIWTQFIIEHRW